MGEIGKDFLPEDIFAEVESDVIQNNRKDISINIEQENTKADINQKKGQNLNEKHPGKTNKNFLLVLLFVFFFIIVFVFIMSMIYFNLNNEKNNKKEHQEIIVNDNSVNDLDNKLKDTDGDGLIDIEEDNFGTDINVVDTDNDFIFDGDEAKKYNTSPLNPDTDGDGLSDYDEIFIYETNPLSSDTDGDGYRDMDEINNGYSPINSDKITPEYSKKIENAKLEKEKFIK